MPQSATLVEVQALKEQVAELEAALARERERTQVKDFLVVCEGICL